MAVLVSDVMEAVHTLPAWKVEFIKRFVQHGDFKYGEMIKLINSFAEEKSLSTKTISNFYYNEFKKGKEAQVELLRQRFQEEMEQADTSPADKIAEGKVAEKPAEENKPGEPVPAGTDAKSEPKAEVKSEVPNKKTEAIEMSAEELQRLADLDPDKFTVKNGDYKKGRLVEVRVMEVREYGAFVETTDGFRAKGLIHNSEITPGEYVNNANKFFALGDVVRATIIDYESNRNRLRLSTRSNPPKDKNYINASVGAIKPTPEPEGEVELKLPASNPPINTLADKLAAVKDKIVTGPTAKAHEKPQIVNATTQESEFVKAYLNGIVGAVTPEAEQMMLELIKANGMFKFTLALTKAAAEFKPDLGLILMKEIDSKIGECL